MENKMTDDYSNPPIGAVWRSACTWHIQTSQGSIEMGDEVSAVEARMLIRDYNLYANQAVKDYILVKLKELGINKP